MHNRDREDTVQEELNKRSTNAGRMHTAYVNFWILGKPLLAFVNSIDNSSTPSRYG